MMIIQVCNVVKKMLLISAIFLLGCSDEVRTKAVFVYYDLFANKTIDEKDWSYVYTGNGFRNEGNFVIYESKGKVTSENFMTLIEKVKKNLLLDKGYRDSVEGGQRYILEQSGFYFEQFIINDLVKNKKSIRFDKMQVVSIFISNNREFCLIKISVQFFDKNTM